MINKKPALLYIEDELELAQMYQMMLKTQYEVTIKSSGAEALAWLKNNNVKVILADYCLPDIEGKTLVESLQEETKSTPIVVISGFSDVKTQLEALDSGAKRFLVKPVAISVIRKVVQEII